ncbi:MAG: AMP-binding protein, partial [Clostridia bacterium]|nr:AMP-binding protein [Clostridia bacterium]
EETLLSVLPINHAFCINMDLLVPMRYGYTVAVCHDVRKLFHAMQVFGPHSKREVPIIHNAIRNRLVMTKKQHPDWSTDDIRVSVVGPNMVRIICGGGYMSPELKDGIEAFGLTCMQGYGMTETSPKIAVPYLNEPDKKESVGFLVRGMEARLVEEELQVRGPSVMMGYYRDPDRTAEAITEDGWLRTGDLCRIDEDGYVYLIGRKKNLIILSNGENIAPEPIENLFDGDLLIKEIVVREKNDHLVCEVFPNEEVAEKSGVTDVLSAIRDIVEQKNRKLPQYSQLTEVLLREKPFPRTASNKIVRENGPLTAPKKGSEGPSDPAGNLEQTLLSLFATILGTEDLHPEDNLFSKGLDSLGAVLFLEELETKTGKTLALSDLLKYKTVAAIADLLTQEDSTVYAHPVQETYPLTNMQKYFGYIIRGHTTGNLPFHYELDPSVDLPLLKRAIEATLDAHPLLKGTIKPDQTGVLAMWRDDSRHIDLPLKTLTKEEWEEEKKTLTRPFSFAGDDDLFHIALYEVEDEKFLAFDIAHIAGDGVTIALLFEDIDRAYRGEPLQKEQYTFYDYALDDLREDENGARERTTEYYSELLKGVKFRRNILTRRHPTSVEKPVMNAIHEDLQVLGKSAVKDFVAGNGVSENVLFLTAFNYVVGLYGDEQDFYTTSIFHGRTDARWRHIAGPLFRQYFVRNSFIPHETTRSYLQRTGRQVMDTMDIPISVPRHGEMFFQFQGDLFSRKTLAGKPAKVFFTQLDALPFHMMVIEKENAYAVELRFWENRFEEGLLRQFLRAYEAVLVAMMTEPSTRCLKRHLPEDLFPAEGAPLILDKDGERKPFGAWGRLMQDGKDTGRVARVMPDGTLDYLEESGRTVMTEGHLGRRYYDLQELEESANRLGPLVNTRAALIYDKSTNETKLSLDIGLPKETIAELCRSYGEEVYDNEILSADINVTGVNARAKKTPQMEQFGGTEVVRRDSTGYPSKDRPWMDYFATKMPESLDFRFPEGTLYEYMKACNEENLNYPALNYFGNTFTFKEFLKRIDEAAKALVAAGVKPGDVVPIVAVSCVPSAVLFYAINKVGAISTNLNVLSSEEDLTGFFNEAGGKVAFVLDVFTKTALPAARASDTVEKLVVCDLKHDLPFYIKPFFETRLEEKPDNAWKTDPLC